MAYTPTEWKSGDVITAEKLNNMEEGISDSNVLIVNTHWDNTTSKEMIDLPFEKMVEATNSGKIIVLNYGSPIPLTPNDTPSGIDSYWGVLITHFLSTHSSTELINYHIDNSGVLEQTSARISINPN